MPAGVRWWITPRCWRCSGCVTISAWCWTWEPEPDLNLDLLDKVDIATAHIAGYTLEGKARGTTQVFEAWSEFIGQPQQVALDTLLPRPEFGTLTLHGKLDQPTLKRLVHLVYDVRRDDAAAQSGRAAGRI